MSSAKAGHNQTPVKIVIKKVEEDGHGHGHHGGAWKVAYADFVTAMMAFFLLLWLLGTSEEDKLKGIADYYKPSEAKVGGLGGNPHRAGETVDSRDRATGAPIHAPDLEGEGEAEAALALNGGGEVEEVMAPTPPGQPVEAIDAWSLLAMQATAPDSAPPSEAAVPEDTRTRAEEAEQMAAIQEELEEAILNNPSLAGLADSIAFERVEDGLLIEIMDQDERPMFTSGRARFESDIAALVARVGVAVADLPNPISVTGHTDAVPFASNATYGNWELSADRANATRRLMIEAGVDTSRFTRVSGMAATDPQRPDAPKHPSNRRVSVHLLFNG